ncbi:MAG: hypothetical protein DME00_06910 [Candidatus Rokuibacteriota bacterium]|nr:MAG: hypothetical protein DME00_06910 [Candidatus Rokubacteria bacterium]
MTSHHNPKDFRWRVLLRLTFIATLLLVGPLAGYGWSQVVFPAQPASGSFVVDEAKLLTPVHRQEIESVASALNREHGYPVTVVTIRSLSAQRAAAYSIERYASEMLRAWSLDADRRSYGLTLLVSADDRLARIELGSAWTGAHDGRARQIMDRLILPAFRRGDLSQGIVAGVQGFDAMGRGLELPGEPHLGWLMPATQPWWLIPAIAGGILVLIGAVISLGRSGRKGLAWAAAGFIGAIVLSRALAWARGGYDSGDSDGSTEGSGATGKW